MKREIFLKLMAESFDEVSRLESEKCGEYVSEDADDRLSHFKEIGAFTGEPAHQALRGMMVKHTKSIYDMLKHNMSAFSMKKWNEKIHDHMLYLVLLRGLLEERPKDVKDIQPNETADHTPHLEPTPYDKFSSKSHPEAPTQPPYISGEYLRE